ncbi:hypothetical protein JCM3775_005060 [Rhodotorula graminis]|uniref:CASTOR ACT domain-containing protein n=1 Tax=Rhodotorula graminis (strain WP1) TaxID=578459 RepID=A0A194S180_RHOGW|nr:uncharacterized protein RHOBADRAFT_44786 [Rhodotorula graminis WP1]KPV74300.1 hypothetical protein RHOBADRAFT_44786 [Rhodotorula graminis WP1]
MATLDLSNPALELSFLPTQLSVIQLAPSRAIPPKLVEAVTSAGPDDFVSITRCPDEISVILATTLLDELYPPTAKEQPVESLGPWVAVKVKGPMDLSLTGILHELSRPLKTASVPIFASSTWNTDYVLIEERHKGAGRAALEEAGWKFAA